MGRLCCPKCCEGYHEELDHCPRCGPLRPDCDAYEKRIAELEAALTRETLIGIEAKKQLARVKAESLRVVPTKEHEMGHWEVAMAVFVGGATTIYERYDSEDGNLVRLERWETEE